MEPVEDVGAELEALGDEVAPRLVVPERLDHGEKLLGMTVVDLGVEGVMGDLRSSAMRSAGALTSPEAGA